MSDERMLEPSATDPDDVVTLEYAPRQRRGLPLWARRLLWLMLILGVAYAFYPHGFDDLIVGAPDVYSEGGEYSGESYVIFGRETGFDASLDIDNLDGNTGFRILGEVPWGVVARTARSPRGGIASGSRALCFEAFCFRAR